MKPLKYKVPILVCVSIHFGLPLCRLSRQSGVVEGWVGAGVGVRGLEVLANADTMGKDKH